MTFKSKLIRILVDIGKCFLQKTALNYKIATLLFQSLVFVLFLAYKFCKFIDTDLFQNNTMVFADATSSFSVF